MEILQTAPTYTYEDVAMRQQSWFLNDIKKQTKTISSGNDYKICVDFKSLIQLGPNPQGPLHHENKHSGGVSLFMDVAKATVTADMARPRLQVLLCAAGFAQQCIMPAPPSQIDTILSQQYHWHWSVLIDGRSSSRP